MRVTMLLSWIFGWLLLCLAADAAISAPSDGGRFPTEPTSDFEPDPASVTREGAGYRYPQSGWTVVHIEGAPYERGYQHGKLLAAEIVANLRHLATSHNPRGPEEAWRD
ncbi:MAG TPA: hypothetical protein VHV08_04740, partial [Pirellulales bacterium]|nr:hypothetical protein [Pirellulales bacterium]